MVIVGCGPSSKVNATFLLELVSFVGGGVVTIEPSLIPFWKHAANCL
ncbi:hypothetical protein UACE39S_06566 [Ureibacillus acetophenoni]